MQKRQERASSHRCVRGRRAQSLTLGITGRSQKARLERFLANSAVPGVNVESSSCWPGRDNMSNAIAGEMERRPIVERIASAQGALLDQCAIRGSPARLAIVVRTATAGKEAEAGHRAKGTGRIGMPLLCSVPGG